MISGKPSDKLTAKKEVVATSIAEDLCYATTQGKWKMPKHILLSISIHHLTASAELVSILNRYGHCQSYSMVLELETAMANVVKVQNSILSLSLSMSLLPPCVSSLRLHSLRANYQAFIWKNSHVGYTDLPMPEGNGWTKNEMGLLCVDWTSGDIMPQQLVDVLSDTEKDERSCTVP